MKILFIGSGRTPSTFIQRRLDALNNKGMDCLLPKEQYFSKYNVIFYFFKALIINPKRFYYFIRILFLQNDIGFLAKVRNAIKYIDFISVKPDIIHFQWIDHVHSFEWIIKYFSVPVVASVRGSMVTIYPINNPDYTKTLLKSFHLADQIHCVSNSLNELCVNRFAIDRYKVFTNYNGININSFVPNNLVLKDKPFKLITVGSLIWRKGVLFQLLILSELRKLPIVLTCIGTGEDEVKLRYQVKKLGLEEKVNFVGNKTQDEIISYLQESDIYISTSIAEGLSNSVLEAASVGLPVVAFDCEGMHEVVINKKTGYVVPYGNISLMAKHIEDLFVNREKLITLGIKAREHVVNNFDINFHVDEMIQFYKKMKVDENQ